jgi:hypothetical protein
VAKGSVTFRVILSAVAEVFVIVILLVIASALAAAPLRCG